MENAATTRKTNIASRHQAQQRINRSYSSKQQYKVLRARRLQCILRIQINTKSVSGATVDEANPEYEAPVIKLVQVQEKQETTA